MEKTQQNLQLLTRNLVHELSILANRKQNQAEAVSNSRGLQPISIPKRIDLCRKAGSCKRGLRKSSSLTNGIGRARNKALLKEYGTEARGLLSNLQPPSMRSSWAPPLTSTVLR